MTDPIHTQRRHARASRPSLGLGLWELRGVLCLLGLLAGGPGTWAQDPVANWHVLSNGDDVIYGGVGAGGSSVPGEDGIGNWIDGNVLRGNQVTLLGTHGYRQSKFLMNTCVLGPPVAGLSIQFPLILFAYFDQGHANDPIIFPQPGCSPGSGGTLDGLTSAGVLPYGSPPGTNKSFVRASVQDYGTGLAPSAWIGFPPDVILPNFSGQPGGPSALGNILAGAGDVVLPIASTGFCWVTTFTWIPSALASDNTDSAGWWMWAANSAHGNQYWALSNDELNPYSSRTIASTGGQSELIHFFANVEYAWQATSADPTLNTVLAPVGFQGTGPYYTSSVIGPKGPNDGGDMGRHGGVSVSGAGGAWSSVTGLPTQDPGTTGAVPTLGWASWNVDPDLTPSPGSLRTVWVQLDLDAAAGLPPSAGTTVTVWPATGARLPSDVPSTPGVWPQPMTWNLLSVLSHDTSVPQPGPDPLGNPSVMNWDATAQIPLGGLDSTCIGVPVVVQAGSIGWVPGSHFDFVPGSHPVSNSVSITVID